jgi:hypothetical protein
VPIGFAWLRLTKAKSVSSATSAQFIRIARQLFDTYRMIFTSDNQYEDINAAVLKHMNDDPRIRKT